MTDINGDEVEILPFPYPPHRCDDMVQYVQPLLKNTIR